VCVQANSKQKKNSKLLLHSFASTAMLFHAPGVASSDASRRSNRGSTMHVMLVKISELTVKPFAPCSLSEQGGFAAIAESSR
jgi:hypothetical protein